MSKDLTLKLDEMFRLALEHPTWMDYAKNAKQDFEFREGKQWTSKEIKDLESRGQPVIVENEIKPVIDRLIGQYKNQKTRIIFRGRNLGPDEQWGNLISDLMLHTQQNSGYEFEEGDMFDDGAVSGFGVLEVSVDFDDGLKPTVTIEHEDGLNVFPDPFSRRYNWNEDADYICRAKWVELSEAKQIYPTKANALMGFVNRDPVDNSTSELKKDNYVDDRKSMVRLVEIWRKDKKVKKIAFKEDGMEDVSKIGKREERALEKQGVNILRKVVPQMKVSVFCGDVLLEDKDSPYDHNMFPFVPYFVYRKKNGEPYSIVRLLIDPQTEINKRRSKALHLLNTNQVVADDQAIIDIDELKREVAKPDGIIRYKGSKNFEIIKNVEVAQSQMALLQESKLSVGRISGLNDESRGLKSEVRSGVGLQRKQMMTDIIITPIFDNLRRTRLMVGRLCFELFKQYYTEERVFSITDDMNRTKQVWLPQEAAQKFKDIDVDIVIEEAPDTTTLQDEQFRMISDTLQTMNLPANLSMFFFPLLVRLSQIRDKEAILKEFEQANQPQPETPKMSLNFQWVELTPEEKAWVAQNVMQAPDLAQIELQTAPPPAHMTKAEEEITKTEIKAGADIAKEAMSAERDKNKSQGD